MKSLLELNNICKDRLSNLESYELIEKIIFTEDETKEIGVLRSLGARKKDISRVFNAETLIIGLLSGVLGVGTSLLLSIPINLIVNKVAGGVINNIASLDPMSGIILIIISVVLTLVAGFVPAKIAAKKDPVKALRTE